MPFIAIILLVLLGLFAFVILYGAPYLPTKKKQINSALDLLNLERGQTLLELGCGDGRVLRAAAMRGLKGVGYELNPMLVLVAKLATWRYRQSIRIIWGNYWRAQWPPAESIYTFLLDKYMKKFDTKVTQYAKHQSKPVKVVSFAFKIPDKKPAKTKNGLFLYRYK